MPRSNITEAFYIETARLDGTEPIIECVELSVPFYPKANVVRLVNDSDAIDLNGRTYVPASFNLTLPDDVERQNPQGSIQLAIVSRELVKMVENTNGAQGALIRLLIALRSTLTVEFDITMEFSQITLANGSVRGTIGFPDLLRRASLNQRYDSKTAKGLF